MAKIHAYIISSLKADMPKMFGKSKKKKALIKDLPTLLKRVQEEHLVSASDIPPSETLQAKLQGCDFTKFPPLKEKLIQAVDQMLDQDIAELMSIVPQDAEEPAISGGAFSDVKDTISPFGYMKCEVNFKRNHHKTPFKRVVIYLEVNKIPKRTTSVTA